MLSASRSMGLPQDAGPVGGSAHRLRRALGAGFWSPVLLLAGAVQVLCHPRVKALLIGAIVLDIPLQWGTHLGFRENGSAMGALNGFDISITTLALVGLYVGWLFTARAECRSPRIVWNWPIATYSAAVVASLAVSSDVQLSLFEVFLIMEMLLVYLYLAANITSRAEVVSVFRLILIGGILEAAYMLILAAVGHEFAIVRALGFKSEIYVPEIPGEVIRYGGTVGSANSAAAYLAMVITLAVAARYLSPRLRLRRLTTPLLILAVAALLVTLSRGGWIEVTLSVAIVVGATWLRSGVTAKRAVLCGAAVGIIAACLYFPNPVSKRLTGDDNGSAYSRVPLMHLAEHMIAAHPVFGVGANNFAAVMQDYEGPEFRHAWIYTVHNQFLLVWSETGLVGLLAYLWIFGSLIRGGWRLWKTRDAIFAPIGLGIVATLWGLLSHMSVEDFSSRPMIQFVWVLAALLAACEVIQRNERAEENSLQIEHGRAESVAV